jgi:hypothetical protein
VLWRAEINSRHPSPPPTQTSSNAQILRPAADRLFQVEVVNLVQINLAA